MEEFGGVFTEEVTVGVDESNIESFDARVASDVLGDGIVELPFAYLTDNARFTVVFIERDEGTVVEFEHGCSHDGLGELRVGLCELLVVLCELSVVLSILLIFSG